MAHASLDEPALPPSSAVAHSRAAPLAGVVALVGCDGSGKTRLAYDLVRSLKQQGRQTERRYMGLVSGEGGDKIKKLPVIGKALERYLSKKVRRAQDMKEHVPGVFTAIVMYLFSLWRLLQMRRLRNGAQGGTLMIAERYPQAEVPGFHYDGPGIAVERSQRGLVRALARREHALYERMACWQPALVIRLVIDADTAHARKPDHPLAELQDKTVAMAQIHYNGAPIFEIDARLPYEQVLQTALDAINKAAPPQ